MTMAIYQDVKHPHSSNQTTPHWHPAMSPSPSAPSWDLSLAASAFFWCISLTLTSLTIVSFPHRISRIVSIPFVLLTGCGAFRTGNNILPDAVFVDYYLRFVIILVSHVTWLVYSGTLKRSVMQEGGMGKGWMSGYKKLFNPRGVGEVWELPDLWPPKKQTSGPNGEAKARTSVNEQSRSSAVLSHFGHVIVNFTLLCSYYVCSGQLSKFFIQSLLTVSRNSSHPLPSHQHLTRCSIAPLSPSRILSPTSSSYQPTTLSSLSYSSLFLSTRLPNGQISLDLYLLHTPCGDSGESFGTDWFTGHSLAIHAPYSMC